jgi:hypothetical protein
MTKTNKAANNSPKKKKAIKSKKKGPITKKKTAKVGRPKKSSIIKKARNKADKADQDGLQDLKALSDETKAKKKKTRKRRKKLSPFTRITVEHRSSYHKDIHSEVIENKPENVRVKVETNWDKVFEGKVLGYCPGEKGQCNKEITTLDLEEGKSATFICTECNYTARINRLIKDAPEKEEENFDPWK